MVARAPLTVSLTVSVTVMVPMDFGSRWSCCQPLSGSMPRLQGASSLRTSGRILRPVSVLRSDAGQFTQSMQFTQFTREKWQCASPNLFYLVFFKSTIHPSTFLHSPFLIPFPHSHHILPLNVFNHSKTSYQRSRTENIKTGTRIPVCYPALARG